MRNAEYMGKQFSLKGLALAATVFAFVAVGSSLFFAQGAEAANRYRVGTGDWNTTASWSATSGGASGASVPGSADLAIFEATSTASMTLDATVNVLGVRIDSGYTGTITQNTGIAVTVGTTGWTQAGGSFSGGNSAITVSGAFALNGGIATSTSGTLTLNGCASAITMASTPTATFNHNGGAIDVRCGTNSTNTRALDFGDQRLNNATFSRTYNNASAYTQTAAITGTMYVDGNLTMSITDTTGANDDLTFNTGTIEVKGNYTASTAGTSSDILGTANVKFTGASPQTIGGATGNIGDLPNGAITLDNGGTVSLAAHVTVNTNSAFVVATGTTFTLGNNDFAAGALTLSGGFNGGSGAITVSGAFALNGGIATSTSGTLTLNGCASAITMASTPTATLNHNGGAIDVQCGTNSTNTRALDFGDQRLNNATFSRTYNNASAYTQTAAITGTMYVDGNLTMSITDTTGANDDLTFNTGTIEVKGNYTASTAGTSSDILGTANVKFTGASPQTIGGATGNIGDLPNGAITLDNGGTVSLAAHVTVNTNSAFVVATGTTFTLGNNDFAAGALTLSGGFNGGSGAITVSGA